MLGSPQQMLIILLVIILLFGAKKLPQLARSLAESMNEFKKAKEEAELEERRTASAPASENKNTSETHRG